MNYNKLKRPRKRGRFSFLRRLAEMAAAGNCRPVPGDSHGTKADPDVLGPAQKAAL